MVGNVHHVSFIDREAYRLHVTEFIDSQCYFFFLAIMDMVLPTLYFLRYVSKIILSISPFDRQKQDDHIHLIPSCC